MKQLHFFLSTLLLVVFVACGDDSNEYKIGGKTGEDTPVQPDERQSAGPEIAKYNLEFPALKGGNSIVVVHSGILNDTYNKSGVNYSVEWDTSLRAQRWSCYQMYEDNYKSGAQVTRYNAKNDGSLSPECQYPNDPDLPESYRLTADPYKGSGFDHGHICPSADRQRAVEANYQTFYITNMQPQNNKFNAGIWADMENQVRTWANNFDTLYVCKGGTIDKSDWILRYLGSGNNKIPVPKYFFMAVLGKKGSNFKATGFWIAQDSYTATTLQSYAVTIQALQKNTGIDFFCNLPDDIENEVENIPLSQMEKEWTWFK
jgi:endonuclease G